MIWSSHKHSLLKLRHICVWEEVFFFKITTFCKHRVGLIGALACPQLLQPCQVCQKDVGFPPTLQRKHDGLIGQNATWMSQRVKSKILPWFYRFKKKIFFKKIFIKQKVKEIFESDHTSSSMAAYHTDGSFPESFEFDQFSVLLGHSTQFGSH